MAPPKPIRILVAVRPESVTRFRAGLADDPQLAVTAVDSEIEMDAALGDPARAPDVLAVDRGLCDTFALVGRLRRAHPRLMIIVIDEDADFATPGSADEVTTAPFSNGDLARKIKRLAEERSVATLRADALPGVRSFVKALRKAGRGVAKQQAAVSAIKELGYDHVACYAIMPGETPSLSLVAQLGPDGTSDWLPTHADMTGGPGWVAEQGQLRILKPGEPPGHPLLDDGRYGAAICSPIGTTLRFGVIIAFRAQPGSITQHDAVMVELISAQLASALVKDQRP